MTRPRHLHHLRAPKFSRMTLNRYTNRGHRTGPDDFLEIMPKNIRMRKRELDPKMRKRSKDRESDTR